MRTGSVRLGLDIGGTFTDVALEHGGARWSTKVLTTADAPERGALDALDRVLRLAGRTPGDVGLFVHGTTLATNALIERKGAVTALITTEGFRDALEIGTEGRPDQYDIDIVKPRPLVPRRRRFTVRERLNARGEVLEPLDPQSLDPLLGALDRAGVTSVAIGLLHAYANPAHEQRLAEWLAARRPDLTISLSSEVSPEFREYERISTTVANAYVRPLMAGYLARFEAALREIGIPAPLALMLSSGGLTDVATASRFPVRLVESGPAGGAIFAAEVARANGLDRVLSFDMGGTTAKICLVDDATPQQSPSFEVARVYRFKKGSGLPLRIPVIEMVEIGAGGGSIARVDDLRRLNVGPESAGADPGPVAYGRGGVEPTVTDANVMIGRIDPEGFAGGTMQLDAAAVERALERAIGEPLGIAAGAAAFGVVEMVSETMAAAARVHGIESSKQLGNRTLVAFGGAAPLHACQLADKLGMDAVLVPRSAGVGSAVGFLRAPIAFEVVRTRYQRLETLEAPAVNAVLEDMEALARDAVARTAAPGTPVTVVRSARARYVGQGHEIAFRLPDRPLDETDRRALRQAFDAAYAALYGRAIERLVDVELVSFLVAVATDPHPDPLAAPKSTARAAVPTATRRLFDTGRLVEVEATVVHRPDLAPGFELAGPALVVEDETTTVVGAGFRLAVLVTGDLLLRRTEMSR